MPERQRYKRAGSPNGDLTPDLFMASSESEELATVRACWIMRELPDAWVRGLVEVRIEPPLIGQPYGLGAKDIHTLLIVPRWEGASVRDAGPTLCNVFMPRDAIGERGEALRSLDDVSLTHWAEVHRTREAADAYSALVRQRSRRFS